MVEQNQNKDTGFLPPLENESGEQFHTHVNPFSDEPLHNDTVPWVIEFRMTQVQQMMQVQVREMMTIGRGTGVGAPDIDLGPYQAQENGVSRRHAIILARRRFLTLRDLNSTNGTFINGLRLMPNQDIPLEHGDHLRFGRLEVEVKFAVVPPQKMASPESYDTAVLDNPFGNRSGRGKHILILEDDIDVATVYRMMFEESGYRVTLVDDPTEAAAIFVDDMPNGVVLDLMIQRQSGANSDGLDLLRLLQNRVQRLRLRVPMVVVSGASEPDIIKRAKESGATAFIAKPVRVDELVMRLSELIRKAENTVAP